MLHGCAMLNLTRIRELTLQEPTAPDRPAWLSAASGLVRVGAYLYVVADDELHLGMFSSLDAGPGRLLRLLPGELPRGLKKRKKHKPDFEVLLRLPPFAGYGHGALLALGSGSTQRRCLGSLLMLKPDGAVQGEVRVIDATPWFEQLTRDFDELNLEGAWVSGQHLCLLQRGNKGSINAVLHFHLDDFLNALSSGTIPALPTRSVHEMQLGYIEDVPLCFSDGCALPDGDWLFTAVAEATDNAYADGAFVGAAVGRVNAQQQLVWLKQVTPSCKIEGIDVVQQADGQQVLLVTDADTVHVPALLLSAELGPAG